VAAGAKLAGPGDVDDLVHEIFLVVGVGCRSFAEAKVTTWLYRIRNAWREKAAAKTGSGVGSRAQALEIERTWRAASDTVDEFERRQSSETVYRILDDCG